MKSKIFFCVMFLMNSLMFAQSDYEALQNFKDRYKQIEESIKNASSLEECNVAGEKINDLRSEFIDYKLLLDKALYPENFESSFAKIENSIESKRKDLSRISTLATQVETLQTQVKELNQKNDELMKQIEELRTKSDKDRETIAELKRLVAQLKGNINQRDLLVRDFVDSLLVEFTKSPHKLSQKETQTIISKVNKSNLFYNIERTIADNIRFTQVTQMTADDFVQMKKQYRDFNKVWRQIGPKLSSVYLSRKQKKSEIPQIDSLFAQWNDQINSGIWKSIRNLFVEKNINLDLFNNSSAFVNSVNSFIDDEIKNLGTKSKNESENIFHTFTDSIYFRTIEKKWIPMLVENNMMTQPEKTIIDARIEKWKEAVAPSYLYLGFIISGIVFLIVIVFLFRKSKKSSIKIDKLST